MEEPLNRPDSNARPVQSAAGRGWSLSVKIVVIVVLAALLGLLAWATLAAGRGQNLLAKIRAGEKPPAPAFELDILWPETQTWPKASVPALADGKLALAELRGRPAVLNFWASWCVPCRDEAPILRASALRHRGQVVFVGIDVRDLSSDARSFLRKYKVNYVSARDRADATWNDYGLTGVPETYYLDARGRILAHTPGAVSARTLEEGIAVIAG